MVYTSTRNKDIKFSASEAILKGLSDDGGLFVPEVIPKLEDDIKALAELDYQELAYRVMKLYLDDFSEEELRACIRGAYGDGFDDLDTAPLSYAAGSYYLELYHGPTIAFKDMALQILPHLMTTSAKKQGLKEDIVILTATSGDTGKAAMAGFADVDHTRIMVFFPDGGVSDVQRLQMVTQKGKNVSAVSVEGNFDDCQTGVKKLFNDKELREWAKEKGFVFSSANSINIGRLVPQIVYYIYAYCKLLANEKIAAGDKINICVPTGNFGNILAAYLAKEMGLPVEKLICASNMNNVLTDFFATGVYDRRRDFHLTMSPSMDILISSNLERLVYLMTGRDAAKTAELMASLSKTGKYELDKDMMKVMDCFVAGYATEEETSAEIRRVYEDTGYVIDTHTAVASAVVAKLKGTLPEHEIVIASTASPYKFSRNIVKAINKDKDYSSIDDMGMIDELTKITGLTEPHAIEEIRGAKVLHDEKIAREGMKAAVQAFLEKP